MKESEIFCSCLKYVAFLAIKMEWEPLCPNGLWNTHSLLTSCINLWYFLSLKILYFYTSPYFTNSGIDSISKRAAYMSYGLHIAMSSALNKYAVIIKIDTYLLPILSYIHIDYTKAECFFNFGILSHLGYHFPLWKWAQNFNAINLKYDLIHNFYDAI